MERSQDCCRSGIALLEQHRRTPASGGAFNLAVRECRFRILFLSLVRNPSSQAEILFSQALELPGGKVRSDFVARRCASDLDLRREVESLLQAHAEAGTFLELPGETTVTDPSHPQPVNTQTSLSAAAHAATYLQRSEDSLGPASDKYLAGLPEEVRRETQERIAAGLQVRRLNGSSQGVPAPSVQVEPHFPGYRLEGKIGEGSLGIVYRAYDEKLNRAVAIKVLRSQVGQSTGRRLLNEARQAAALNDPAFVTIFSVLDERPPAAIVMELAEGYPIDRYAAQLSFEQKARLLRDVSRGLGAAHARGLIHRDLKPDNVIVGPDMRPRILDFGLALSLDEAATQARGFEGTPLYASPEQVRGGALGPASDVFSLGCLMFKVLTDRPPFTGGTVAEVLEAIATTAPPLLREVAFGVPEDLQAICLACLAWDPADRPTAPEVTLELGRFIAGEPVGVRPRLYDDLLRRSISEYSLQTGKWLSQSIISREERDSLEVVHRRLLADEDHWIIDARRITLPQTMLSAGTWLTVVATALTVWMLRQDLGPLWRWLLPVCFTFTLLLAGYWAQRLKEQLAAATFLAGAALAIAPSTLALLAEMNLLAHPAAGVAQLFPSSFSNQQVAAASCTALAISALSLWRLKMTGFAWTTAALACASYLSVLVSSAHRSGTIGTLVGEVGTRSVDVAVSPRGADRLDRWPGRDRVFRTDPAHVRAGEVRMELPG